MDVHIFLITWCNWAPHTNNYHHCTANIRGTSACLLSPSNITKRYFLVISQVFTLLLMLLPVFFSSPNLTVLFRGLLKQPSGIIASVDHADYSGYLSAVKALHLLPAPYKSISSKAFLCRSPGSFPSDDECGTFFIETGEAGISVQCAHFATAVQRWGKNKWAANLAK